jgi:large conductance mechanosensitive channel
VRASTIQEDPVLKEFREFAMRGNMVDMAVGIVIGAAFGRIVSSLVKDVIMPPVGLLLGNADFSELYLNLGGGTYESLAAAQEAGAATLNYGMFINTLVDFFIVAFAIFVVVKATNAAKRKQEPGPAPAPSTKDCPECLSKVPIGASRCAYCTASLIGSGPQTA